MSGELILSTLSAERHITIARPDDGNTLPLDGIRALAAAIRQAGADDSLKLIRIRANGQAPKPPRQYHRLGDDRYRSCPWRHSLAAPAPSGRL